MNCCQNTYLKFKTTLDLWLNTHLNGQNKIRSSISTHKFSLKCHKRFNDNRMSSYSIRLSFTMITLQNTKKCHKIPLLCSLKIAMAKNKSGSYDVINMTFLSIFFGLLFSFPLWWYEAIHRSGEDRYYQILPCYKMKISVLPFHHLIP